MKTCRKKSQNFRQCENRRKWYSDLILRDSKSSKGLLGGRGGTRMKFWFFVHKPVFFSIFGRIGQKNVFWAIPPPQNLVRPWFCPQNRKIHWLYRPIWDPERVIAPSNYILRESTRLGEYLRTIFGTGMMVICAPMDVRSVPWGRKTRKIAILGVYAL